MAEDNFVAAQNGELFDGNNDAYRRLPTNIGAEHISNV